MSGKRGTELPEMLKYAMERRKITQARIARLCGVTPTAVHHWVNGERSPDLIHTAQLAIVLDLDPRKLGKAAGHDPEKATALYQILITNSLNLDGYTEDLKRAQQVRVAGDPKYAAAMAAIIGNKLEPYLGRPLSPGFLTRLRRLCGEAWLEQATAIKETIPIPDILRTTDPIGKKIEKLAVEYSDDEELYFKHLLFEGHTHYTREKFDKAIVHLDTAFHFAKESERRLFIARTLTLSHANLIQQGDGNERQFEKFRTKTIGIIESNEVEEPEQICLAYQGLGLAEGKAGRKESLYTLEKAWKELNDANEEWPFRYIQILKSEVEVRQILDPTDPSIEEQANEGLDLTRGKYQTNENHFREFLSDFLN